MDYYPQVKQILEEADCRFVTFIRPGVESWRSPRAGVFSVDNPIRSASNANNILRAAGCAPVFKQ